MLSPIERTAYLYYYTLYRKYITPVDTFHRVFNREFYKYTCDGDSNDTALWKVKILYYFIFKFFFNFKFIRYVSTLRRSINGKLSKKIKKLMIFLKNVYLVTNEIHQTAGFILYL